jgi:hypothetical protein
MFIAAGVFLFFFQAPSGAACHIPPLTGLGREETAAAINITLLRSKVFSNRLSIHHSAFRLAPYCGV